jgi:hypothetical protein
VIAALEAGRSPILLTERKDHLESLLESLMRVSVELETAQDLIVGRLTEEDEERLFDEEQKLSLPEMLTAAREMLLDMKREERKVRDGSAKRQGSKRLAEPGEGRRPKLLPPHR